MMKLPISKRLLRCGSLVPPCHTVADLGTDHGYLAIHLLQTGRCAHVIASDLREKPLASARANAEKYKVSGGVEFRLSDGLAGCRPGEFDALVMAGMGGDLITRILEAAPWLEEGDYTLILQPQSAANELRRWLGERRWSIDREVLVRDGGFLYSVLSARPRDGSVLSPGEQYASPALRREGDPLFPDYLARITHALELTVSGISKSADPEDQARAVYYAEALEELRGL